ncbi:unnamed protein product [Zymoseptoria tritici ST99CH_1E4]|uniref:Retrotransposon gag domain-containing protein n=1 Tax=Zymoseptoria tritici ST99CH_1E4 TaxID=1276532 RepID=A0A2H1H9L3_ZYMTR|nr:unnamed protein product [Zymoseptoria tritici ST99CH_1E4]
MPEDDTLDFLSGSYLQSSNIRLSNKEIHTTKPSQTRKQEQEKGQEPEQSSTSSQESQESPLTRRVTQTIYTPDTTEIMARTGRADLSKLDDFKGTPDEDARRWMAKFDRLQSDAGASPANWLTDFDMSMAKAAADWSDKELAEYWGGDTQADVDAVKAAFLRKWKKTVNALDARSASQQINNLMQGNESMEEYYARATSLLRKAKGEDSSTATGPAATLLGMAIDGFIKGIKDDDLKIALLQARIRREQQALKDNDLLKEATTAMLQGQPVSAELRARVQAITGVKPSTSKSVNYAEAAPAIIPQPPYAP